jgi:hypothetical protein
LTATTRRRFTRLRNGAVRWLPVILMAAAVVAIIVFVTPTPRFCQ